MTDERNAFLHQNTAMLIIVIVVALFALVVTADRLERRVQDLERRIEHLEALERWRILK